MEKQTDIEAQETIDLLSARIDAATQCGCPADSDANDTENATPDDIAGAGVSGTPRDTDKAESAASGSANDTARE